MEEVHRITGVGDGREERRCFACKRKAFRGEEDDQRGGAGQGDAPELAFGGFFGEECAGENEEASRQKEPLVLFEKFQSATGEDSRCEGGEIDGEPNVAFAGACGCKEEGAKEQGGADGESDGFARGTDEQGRREVVEEKAGDEPESGGCGPWIGVMSSAVLAIVRGFSSWRIVHRASVARKRGGMRRTRRR